MQWFRIVVIIKQTNSHSLWLWKKQVAIKIIDRLHCGKDNERHVKMETEILQKVKHPNIISLYEMIETPSRLYFVLELASGGELFDRIVDKGSYSEEDAKTLVRKMVGAIEYLHEINIAHRDLKPENLLVKSLADDTEVKIADFGLSKIIGYSQAPSLSAFVALLLSYFWLSFLVGEEQMMKTACGTPG